MGSIMFENYLQVDCVNKRYKRGKNKANNNITTTFFPGQITAIIGHNGAGKTTLLNQIIGLVKPDSGDIRYAGKSLIQDTRFARNVVTIMPQFHAPLAGVTLRQSIESILRIRGITGKKNKLLTNNILNELGIEKWSEVSGEKLSGGLQRLTSFAMAVVMPTPILLFDEPTNDVDPVRRKKVWNYMDKLAKQGYIVVVVTHNLLEVEQYAKRYLLFEQGNLIQDNSTSDLRKKFSSSTLILTVEDTEILKDISEIFHLKYYKNEEQVIISFGLEQTIEIMKWVIKKIEDGKVSNYKLSPMSLDISYGRMTNE